MTRMKQEIQNLRASFDKGTIKPTDQCKVARTIVENELYMQDTSTVYQFYRLFPASAPRDQADREARFDAMLNAVSAGTAKDFLVSHGCAASTPAGVAPPGVSAVDPGFCKPGFVWREADANDKVCVVPATRQQARADNAAAASRRNPDGPNGGGGCKPPFVERNAFPGDRSCVTAETRAQAAQDNKEAQNRVQSPSAAH
jgi:hypothetical protein